MDAIVQALVKEGGGWLATAIVLAILGIAVKIFQMLLKREWDRGDRQDAVITKVSATTERVLAATDKLDATTARLLEGQDRLERAIDMLRQQGSRAG